MELLVAETPLGATELGVGRSKIFLCDDGNQYVVKCNHPTSHNRVVANELLGSRLAEWCGLIIPPSSPVLVDQAAIDPTWNDWPPGIQFAIRHEDTFNNLDIINRSPKIVVPFETVFGECENKADFGSILAFDMWIGNNDRAANVGNVIIVVRNDRKYVNIIDHGNAFGGPSSARNLDVTDGMLELPKGPIYEALVKCIPSFMEANPFRNVVLKIESFISDDFRTIYKEMPIEWGITKEEAQRLEDYLLLRAQKLRYSLNRIISEERRYPSIGKGVMMWTA